MPTHSLHPGTSFPTKPLYATVPDKFYNTSATSITCPVHSYIQVLYPFSDIASRHSDIYVPFLYFTPKIQYITINHYLSSAFESYNHSRTASRAFSSHLKDLMWCLYNVLLWIVRRNVLRTPRACGTLRAVASSLVLSLGAWCGVVVLWYKRCRVLSRD